MGRGLSPHQREILRLTRDNGGTIERAKLLYLLYGIRTSLGITGWGGPREEWQCTRGDEGEKARLWTNSELSVGDWQSGAYEKAHAGLSRSLRRLEDRGLIDYQRSSRLVLLRVAGESR